MRKTQKPDVHPEVAARAFHVHLRTIFRWAQKVPGFLRNERISRSMALERLRLWKMTYSPPETRDLLHVRPATVTSWKRRGILSGVKIFGNDRIYVAGVNAVLIQSNLKLGTRKPLLNKDFSLQKLRRAQRIVSSRRPASPSCISCTGQKAGASRDTIKNRQRDLIGFSEVARIIDSFDVQSLFVQGYLRGKFDTRGHLVIYRDSAERFAKRKKKRK
jgi:hypothetical protein